MRKKEHDLMIYAARQAYKTAHDISVGKAEGQYSGESSIAYWRGVMFALRSVLIPLSCTSMQSPTLCEIDNIFDDTTYKD